VSSLRDVASVFRDVLEALFAASWKLRGVVSVLGDDRVVFVPDGRGLREHASMKRDVVQSLREYASVKREVGRAIREHASITQDVVQALRAHALMKRDVAQAPRAHALVTRHVVDARGESLEVVRASGTKSRKARQPSLPRLRATSLLRQ
jgi:hypothetical protein